MSLLYGMVVEFVYLTRVLCAIHRYVGIGSLYLIIISVFA